MGWTAFSAVIVVLVGAGGLILWLFRKELDRSRKSVRGAGRFISTNLGPIEYAETGSGAPLLSIHGAGGGFDQGLAMAAALVGDGFRVLAPSRFGYLGGPVPQDPPLPAQADAHSALLGALNVSSAIVLGVSAGARSAVELALRWPDLVDALVLVVPGTFSPTSPASVDSSQGSQLAFRLVNAGGDFAWWVLEKLTPSVLVRFVGVPPKLFASAPRSERDRVMSLIRNVEPLSLRVAGLRLDSAPDLHELPLEQIRAPTLIISALDDLFNTTPAARFAAAKIPDAKLIVFENGGHLLVGQTAEAQTSIRDFLVELGLSRPDIPTPAQLRGYAKIARADRRARSTRKDMTPRLSQSGYCFRPNAIIDGSRPTKPTAAAKKGLDRGSPRAIPIRPKSQTHRRKRVPPLNIDRADFLKQEDIIIFEDSVARFLDEHAPESRVAKWREAGIVERAIWREAGEAGLLCLSVPEAYGGAGGDFRHEVVLMEQIARKDVSGFAASLHNTIVAPYILHYGSEEQKERWLPKMASGEFIGAIAMSEPGAGSDLQGIKTSARIHGNHSVINGQKTFISNGQLADLVIVVAKTDPSRGAKGISLIVVETAGAEGFHRGRNLDKIGMEAQDTSELFFDDVRVRTSKLLGPQEGMGFVQLIQQLPQERLTIGVSGVAVMERALDLTIAYAKERKAFGQRLIDFQNTQFKLAECKTEATVARVFIDRLIGLHLDGKLDAATASMAKYWVSDLENKVVDACLQLFGGYGYMNEYPIARMFRDSRVQRIYGGSNEIMKVLIARTL